MWEIYTTRTPLSTFKMKTFLGMMKIGNQFAIKQCPIVGPGQRILGTPYTNVSLRRFPGHPGQHFPAFSLRPLAVWPQDTSSPTRDREREREWGPENHGVTVEEDLRVRVDTDDLRRPEQGSVRDRGRESSRGRAAHASALGEKRKRCCVTPLGGRREKRCCRE